MSYRILVLCVVAVCFFYWATPLSFVPVPWPDDSAFFLPGIEWINWPSVYRMHAQAPFVPSYDQANFNTMPGMPAYLGIGALFGLDTSHSIRIFQMMALSAYCVALMVWMRRRNTALPWILLVTGLAVFSPALRWGGMVVRPEIWQGLFWILILMELDGVFQKASAWRLPAILAASAYFHFEAIVWVLPTAVAVLLQRGWQSGFKKLVGIGLRTTALLSPWLLYVIVKWDQFWIQMDVQFHRLDEWHPYIGSAYAIFHNLFLSLGSPVEYPKFFNLGKALTWLALLAGLFGNLGLASRKDRDTGVRVAAALGLVTTQYLWFTKPETWFTTMIHAAIWPAVVLLLPRKGTVVARSKLSRVSAALAGVLLVLSVGVVVNHYRKLSGIYSWETYRVWVDCIEETIGNRKKIWQPHWPDLLVEMAGRDPDRDFSRAVDFPNIEPLIERHASTRDAIVHSLYFRPEEVVGDSDYRGVARSRDVAFVTEYPWLPFKNFAAPHQGAGWTYQACEIGPFWAGISLKLDPANSEVAEP